MIDKDFELYKHEAERRKREVDEERVNPLYSYSTSQLKEELRRRKRGV